MSRVIRLALVLVAALVGRAEAGEVVYAIAVGNRLPPPDQPSLGALRYADDDAVRYHALFARFAADASLFAVLDTETARRHPGTAAAAELPRLTDLEARVDRIAGRMREDRARGDRPVLYLAWSGHGALDPSGAAGLPLDGGGRLTGPALFALLDRLPADYVHLIVDACHAGGVVGARGEPFGEERDGQMTTVDLGALVATDALARRPWVGVLLASAAGQPSHEWSAIEGGVFSHEVLSALHGLGDVNDDGAIEYSEVAAFVAAANRDVADPRALPTVIARPPARDRRVALVRLDRLRGTARWRGDASRLGRFHVELADGTRFADGHRSGESATTLALPAGAVAFLHGAAGEARLVGAPPPGDAFAALRFAPPSRRRRGAVDDQLRARLFASAYGPTYYRGYVDRSGDLGVAFAPPARAAEPPARGLERAPAVAGHRVLATGAVVAGVVALAGGATTLDARSDYRATDLERPAAEARDRYHRGLGLTIGGAAVAVGLGLWAWAIWPDAPVTLAAGSDGAVGVTGRW